MFVGICVDKLYIFIYRFVKKLREKPSFSYSFAIFTHENASGEIIIV